MNRNLKWMLCLGICLAGAAHASDVVGWRTDGTGRYPKAQPVLEWAKDKNVVWSTKMPAWSNAVPVIVGDKVFICAEPFKLICVNKADGSVAWEKSNEVKDTLSGDEAAAMDEKLKAAEADLQKQRDLQQQERELRRKARRDPEAKKQVDEIRAQLGELDKKLKPLAKFMKPRTHGENGFSSMTPVCDGTHVYALFGNGVVAAYDLAGERKWIRHVDTPSHGWGTSSSPVMAAGKLIVQLNGTMHALDPAGGEDAWTAPIRHTWGTSAVTAIGGTPVVITPGGEFIRAEDGKVLAKGKSRNEYNGPLVAEGHVYFIDEGGAVAYKLPEAIEGDAVNLTELWKMQPPKNRYYSSPLYHDGLLYAVHREGMLSVIDAKDGQVLKSKQYKDPDFGAGAQAFYNSICLAGGHVFVSDQYGKTLVLKPGAELEEVKRNQLENTKASAVFEGSRMYVRGKDNLYCIGQ